MIWGSLWSQHRLLKRAVEKKCGLEKAGEGLHIAQAPTVGTSTETSHSMNAPHSLHRPTLGTQSINKPANSGNPIHQLFVLQLCSIPFDVWTLKTLEGKLFSCRFGLVLFFFITLFLLTVMTMEQKVRYLMPGLPNLWVLMKLIFYRKLENSQLPVKIILVIQESVISTMNLKWKALFVP